jgi:Protein of unknown function (DUF3078).
MYAIYWKKIVTLHLVMRKVAFILAVFSALSANAAQPNDSVDGRFYRLFAPTTFYHNVADKSLALNSESAGKDQVADAVDAALLNVYLNRPDLVKATETELKESGDIRNDVNLPIENKVEFVEKVETPPLMDIPQDIPDTVMVQKPKFWTFKGDGFLQFMQNYVSDNWYKGGESNYSMLGSLTLEANYDNKHKWKWDNKLEMKLGFLNTRSDTIHRFKSNEDMLRLTSKVGLEAAKNWYYTLQLLAYSQFSRGLKANDEKTYSDFTSPLYVNLGLGMDYKVETENKRLQGTLNFSPVSLNYIYVDRLNLGPSFGLDEGKHSKLEFASHITADLTWKMNDVVTWKTRLYAFTSYKRALIEWENTFELRVSKYITANLFLFPRFDDVGNYDDDFGYWQFREFSSLGFAYTF